MTKHTILLLSILLVSSCALLDTDSAREDETPVRDVASRKEEALKAAAQRNAGDFSLQALRKRVLVLPFQNYSPLGGEELAKHATDEMKNRISGLNEFILVPETEVQDYQSLLSSTGEPDLKKTVEKARDYGIVAVVMGTIKDVSIKERGNNVGIFKTRYNTVKTAVQVKVFDVLTQKITLDKDTSSELTSESTQVFGQRTPASIQSAQAEGAVSQAIDQMIPQFLSEAQRIGWTGRIAKIDMHRYYINAGERSGVTRNQLLRVFGEAEPVVDRESGLVIGMAPGRFKGFLKVVDFFGEDGAIAVIHSGAGFLEKDRVESYVPPSP